jgi:Predicted sugar phosphatases of the HAD superfamily
MDLKNKQLYIFDMDGTIYLGSRVFGFAIDFINNLRKDNKQILFFTNNASNSPDYYYDKLTRLGFSPSQSEIMTSGDVTIEFLKRHRKDKPVYLVGTPGLEKQFIDSGIVLSETADIVVTSFDTTLTYEKLNIACRLIRNGAEYLSTHPDYNCPVEDGFIPDSGAIAAFVTASTGAVPTYFGKPYPQTIDMICESTGLQKSDMCIFGDRLYTDIALGKRHGVTAILVLSGETTSDDVEKAKIDERPDFVFPSLDEVNKFMFGVDSK